MNWIQVTIFTSGDGIESVTGRLYSLGITGAEIEDKDDFNTFLEENRQSWDYVDEELYKSRQGETCVKIYLSDDAEGHDMLSEVKVSLAELKKMDTDSKFGRLELAFADMKEEDWANNWKKYFKPLKVGKKILIQPEWEKPAQKSDRTVFVVNPGMSFGTGSHATTKLCIEELENYVGEGKKVLDLGCGSGILSIISLLLGADNAVAVDIDEKAVDVAYKNAEMNRINLERYNVFAGDILSDKRLLCEISVTKYDVVLANIVADVIIGIAEIVPMLLKNDGVFIASGIISDRRDEVKAALLRNGFEIISENENGDWVELTLKRR